MSLEIEIRPASLADIDDIRRVAARAWYEAHAPIIGTETTEEFLEAYYDAETLIAHLEADARLLDVAVDRDFDAGVVGFVDAGPTGDDATYAVSRIYVHPDRWGEGIGRRLLEHAERSIDRRGADRIELRVMAENHRAVRFYESAGYRRHDEFYDERVDTRSYTYRKDL